MITVFRKLKKKSRFEDEQKKYSNSFCSQESFMFFITPSIKFPNKLVSHKKTLIFCHLNIGTMRFPTTPWKSLSCSIKQCQFFLSIKGFWDTERLLFKLELGCSYKRRFPANLTNYTWRVKNLNVIFIFRWDTTDSKSW